MKIDFDIGNLFYILLMVIFIIAGTFGKKKKPQTASQPEGVTNEESPEDLLQKKLKEFFGENVFSSEMEPVATEVAGVDEVTVKDVNPVLFERKTGFDDQIIRQKEEVLDIIGYEEGISGLLDINIDSIVDEIKMTEGGDIDRLNYNKELEELIENFDARKGFLYSEIFLRKEY